MPQQMIFNAWEQINGTLRPQYILQDVNTNSQISDKNFVHSVEIARQMSEVFSVSAQAMQIKLKKLGLLKTSSEHAVLFDKWKSTI